jgi:hypothetical protein
MMGKYQQMIIPMDIGVIFMDVPMNSLALLCLANVVCSLCDSGVEKRIVNAHCRDRSKFSNSLAQIICFINQRKFDISIITEISGRNQRKTNPNRLKRKE